MSAAARIEALPLFPLQSVLFPGGVLQLKVFEARYVDLVSRCLRAREPFGVVCLKRGSEAGRGAVQLEAVGVLARIEEVDSVEPGILKVRCIGLRRFRLAGDPIQAANGLWSCRCEPIDGDETRAPGETMAQTVQALSRAIDALRAQGSLPFAEPFRLDDAGWVANRWCELLPVPLAAKQKLMELQDPAVRLSLVDAYLRDKKVIGP